MPHRAPAPAPRPVDPEALARRARLEARSMPPWVALALLVACLLAVNLTASLFRSSTAALEGPAGRDGMPAVPVVVEHPVRDPG
jgi:hypothetical protein